jgi:hypothetical protein
MQGPYSVPVARININAHLHDQFALEQTADFLSEWSIDLVVDTTA